MSGSSTCGLRLQIRDCENKSGTIYYAFTIIDQDAGLWWRFHQRYSQLSDLHEQLLKCKKKPPFESVQIPPFPAKKWWAVQDNNFITQRKRELQDYFDVILSQPEAFNMKPMVSFLNLRDAEPQALTFTEKLSLLEGGGGKGNVDSVPQKTSASSYTAQAYAGEERMSSRYDEDLFGDRQNSSLWDSQLGGGMNSKVVAKQSNLFPSLLSDDDAQTIRKSFDAQSESENNSSLMQFLASPTNQVLRPLQQSILLQNQEEHYALESSTETDYAGDDLYDSKNYKGEPYESQSALCVGGEGCKCCSANSLVNVYQKSVESYRMVEQRYKQQIDQIIEQTEHSSVIEKDLFLDDEEDEEEDEEEQKLNDIIASYDEYDDIIEQYSKNKSPQNIYTLQKKPRIRSNQSGSSRGSNFCNQSKNSSCHRDSVFSVSRCNSTQTEFDDEDERKRGDYLNSNILDELNLNEREQDNEEVPTERSDKNEID